MKLYTLNFRGNETYITDLRIKQDERINDLYYYNIRHDDEGTPCSLEKVVVFDHWGTLVSIKSLDHLLDESNFTELTEKEINDLYKAITELSTIKHEDMLKEEE